MPFKNKVVIITGGAQGIGKATALYFLERKAKVIIVDADNEAGKETAKEYQSLGEIIFKYADIAKENEVKKIVKFATSHFGQLDILINNAGKMIRKTIDKLSLKEWDQVIGSNLTGAFLFTKYAAPALRKSHGAIINIASTRALMSEPNTESYSATKGAIVALTHSLAISLGPKIRVNCISPGWIEVSDWKKSRNRHKPKLTKLDKLQHPAGIVGKPEDIASMIGYLVSEEAAFITGANFVVDGGMTRKMIYD
jgi:hypothetical protein